jgi:hypothetical protein
MPYVIHVCSFTQGVYTVRSPAGGQGIDFEDSNQFGPSKVNLRTGDLSMIPEKHRFWRGYDNWRRSGRPTVGAPISTPIGDVEKADFWRTINGGECC